MMDKSLQQVFKSKPRTPDVDRKFKETFQDIGHEHRFNKVSAKHIDDAPLMMKEVAKRLPDEKEKSVKSPRKKVSKHLEEREKEKSKVVPKIKQFEARDYGMKIVEKDDTEDSHKQKRFKTKDVDYPMEEGKTEHIYMYKKAKAKESESVVTQSKYVEVTEAKHTMPSTSTRTEVFSPPIVDPKKLLQEDISILIEEYKKLIPSRTKTRAKITKEEPIKEELEFINIDPTCMQIRATDGSVLKEREEFDVTDQIYAEAGTSTPQPKVITKEIDSQTGVKGEHEYTLRANSTEMEDECVECTKNKKTQYKMKPPKMKCKQVQTKEQKEKPVKKPKSDDEASTKSKKEKKTDESEKLKYYPEEACPGQPRGGTKSKRDKTPKEKRQKSKSPYRKGKGKKEQNTISVGTSDYDNRKYEREDETETEGPKDANETVSSYNEKQSVATHDSSDDERKDGQVQETAKLKKGDEKEIRESSHTKKSKKKIGTGMYHDIGICTDEEGGLKVCKKIGPEYVEDIVEQCKSAMERIAQLEEKIKEIGVDMEIIDEGGISRRSLKEIKKAIKEDVGVGTEYATESVEQQTEDDIILQGKSDVITDEIGVGTDELYYRDKICKKTISDAKRLKGVKYLKIIKATKRDDDMKPKIKTRSIAVGTAEDIEYDPKKDKISRIEKKKRLKNLMQLWSVIKNTSVGTDDKDDIVDESKLIMKDKSVGTKDFTKKEENKVKKQINKVNKKKRKGVKMINVGIETVVIEEVEGTREGETETWDTDMRPTKDISVGTSDRYETTESLAKRERVLRKRRGDVRLYFQKLREALKPRPEDATCPTCKDKEILRRRDHKGRWIGPGTESDDSMTKKQKPKKGVKLIKKKRKVKDPEKSFKKKFKENLASCIYGFLAIPWHFFLPGQKTEELRFLFNMVLIRAWLNIWATLVMILEVILIFYLGFYWFRLLITWTSILAAYYFNQTLIIGLRHSNDPRHVKAMLRINHLKERREQDKLEEKRRNKFMKNSGGGGFVPEAELEQSESEIERFNEYKEAQKSKISYSYKKKMARLKKALKPSLALIHTVLFVFFVTHSAIQCGLNHDFLRKFQYSNVAMYIFNATFGLIMIIDSMLALFPIKLVYLIVPFLLFGIQYGICKVIIVVFHKMNEYFDTFIYTFDPSKYDEIDLDKVIIMAYASVILWIISIPRYYMNKISFYYITRRKTYTYEEPEVKEINDETILMKRRSVYKGHKKLRTFKFPILL